MSGKLTDLQQLRQTALEAKGLAADVASAAADAIDALEGGKQDRLQRITEAEIDALWGES